MDKNYTGSDFDDFLKEEGIFEEVELTAVKRVFAYRVKELTEENKTLREAIERILVGSTPAYDYGEIDRILRKALEGKR